PVHRYTLYLHDALPISDPAHALDAGLAAQLALRAHLARHPRHLGGERGELADHRVDRLGGAGELALERHAFHLEGHRLGQVAARDRKSTRLNSSHEWIS